MPSALFADRAGIWPAFVGSLAVMILTILLTVPIGVMAAIYLEEFQVKKNRVTEFIQVNIANLSGVPSIVYGMLGLFLFVTLMALGKTLIAGALTMGLLILPLVILVSQESLKAVPRHYREASLALGATRWQTIVKSVMPSALPGILTGVILAAGRAIGETAPLIVVGAVTSMTFAPDSLSSKYMVMPLLIFDWIQKPQLEFRPAAAAAILVLLTMLLILNSAAIIIRARTQKKI
jgi:phosphate transport system permease protein